MVELIKTGTESKIGERERFLLNLKANAEPVFIGNRTFAKASELAEKYGAKAFHFDKLSNILEKTDVLISATAAPHFIIKKEKLIEAENIIENEVKIFSEKFVYEKEIPTHIN